MNIEQLKKDAAVLALNNMLASNYFSICAVDAAAKTLDVRPAGDAYNVLNALHCIHWDKMPRHVRDAVPDLIQQALGVLPVFQFETVGTPVREERDITPDPVPATARGGVLRLLGLTKP